MSLDIRQSVMRLRPTTLTELRAALARERGYTTHVMAFAEDMLPLMDDLQTQSTDMASSNDIARGR